MVTQNTRGYTRLAVLLFCTSPSRINAASGIKILIYFSAAPSPADAEYLSNELAPFNNIRNDASVFHVYFPSFFFPLSHVEQTE